MKRVDCDFAVDRESGSTLGVRACSAFEPADHVTCEKGCVPRTGRAEQAPLVKA
jgi:hypothetical protein